MDISAMNIRIKFQKNETRVDSIGNHLNEWIDYYSCYATISNSNGKRSVESEVVGVIIDNSDIIFTTRYCKKVKAITSTNFRIVWNNEFYDIIKIDYLNLKKKALKFKCEKVRK
jgi:SPP1 family predicted phage head-tail adaptor